MGLDITLYAKSEHEQSIKHDEEWEALYARKSSGEIDDDEYERLRHQITPYASSAQVPSQINPEHLFNRRYLRSSYNGSGFNRAVPEMLASAGEYPNSRGSIYWIFEPLGRDWEGDSGDLTSEDVPALNECRKRAEEVARELGTSDHLRVMTVAANQLGGVDWLQRNDAAALALFREKVTPESTKPGPFGDSGWSGGGLEYFGAKGMTILGAIPGGEKRFFVDEMWPAVHLVYRLEDEGFQSYVQSAEIIGEFIDEALALIEQDGGAYVSWSG